MKKNKQQILETLWKTFNLLRSFLNPLEILSVLLLILAYKRVEELSAEFDNIAEEEGHYSENIHANLTNLYLHKPSEKSLREISASSTNIFREISNRLKILYAESKEVNIAVDIIDIVRYSEKVPLPVQVEVVSHLSSLDLSRASIDLIDINDIMLSFFDQFAENYSQQIGIAHIPPSLRKLAIKILNPHPDESIHFPACGGADMIFETINLYYREENVLQANSSLGSPLLYVFDEPIRCDEKNKNILALVILRLALCGQLRNVNINLDDYLTTSYEVKKYEIPDDIYSKLNMDRWTSGIEDNVFSDRLKYIFDNSQDNPRLSEFKNMLVNLISKISDVKFISPPFNTQLPHGISSDIVFEDTEVKIPLYHGELLYLVLGIEQLREKGRLGIVLPESFLLSEKLAKFRKVIVDSDYIEAIVLLPDSLFAHTSIRTVFVLINKNKVQNRKGKIAFFELKGQKHNRLKIVTDQEIENLAKLLHKADEKLLDISASLEEIQKRHYILVPDRYIGDFHLELKQLIDKGAAATLEELCQIHRGRSRNPVRDENGLPFITTKDLAKDISQPYLDIYGVSKAIPEANTYVIDRKCILVSLIGDALKPTMYDPDQSEMNEGEFNRTKDRGILIGHNIAAIFSDETKVDFEYIYYHLYSPSIRKQFDYFTAGTEIPHISLSDLRSLVIPVLKSPEEQKLFVEQQKSALFEAANAKLQALKLRLKMPIYRQEAQEKAIGELEHIIRPMLYGVKSSVETLADFLEEKNMLVEVAAKNKKNVDITVFQLLDKAIGNLAATAEVLENPKDYLVIDIKEEDYQDVDICKYFKDKIIELNSGKPFKIQVDCKVRDRITIHKKYFPVVINNLIENAEKHAFDETIKNPKLIFNIAEDATHLIIDYFNNGKPFDMDIKDFAAMRIKGRESKGKGLGGYQIKKYIEAHGGVFRIIKDNHPLHFNIKIPKRRQP